LKEVKEKTVHHNSLSFYWFIAHLGLILEIRQVTDSQIISDSST